MFLGAGSLAYTTGYWSLWFAAGDIGGGVLNLSVIGRRMRKLSQITGSLTAIEYLEHRYPSPATRFIAASLSIFLLAFYVLAQFYTSDGEGRIPMILFIPKGVEPPYQVAVFFPGLGSFSNRRSQDDLGPALDFVIRSGRAFVRPIFQGSYGCWDGFLGLSDEEYLRAFREHMVQWREDLGRTLDYLETREDMDTDRVAYFGTSFGASTAIPLLVMEERLKAAVLYSGGLPYRALPIEGDAIDYVPRVTLPVLMLNGAYDYIFPLESKQNPMFELLGTPAEHKRHVVFEAGHTPLPRSQVIQESLAWLDRYLGPIE